MAAIATGIRIGWRKLMTLAVTHITDAAVTMRKTIKSAVSAAHIVCRCQRVGYRCVCTLQSLICVNVGNRVHEESLPRIWIRRLALTHFRLRIIDLLGELFVLRVKCERLLPRFQGLGYAIQL